MCNTSPDGLFFTPPQNLQLSSGLNNLPELCRSTSDVKLPPEREKKKKIEGAK